MWWRVSLNQNKVILGTNKKAHSRSCDKKNEYGYYKSNNLQFDNEEIEWLNKWTYSLKMRNSSG